MITVANQISVDPAYGEAFTQPHALEAHEGILDSSRPDLAEEPRGASFRTH